MQPSYVNLLWVAAAAALGFGISAIFVGFLRLSRSTFLVPYFILAGSFLGAYARWGNLNLEELLRRNALLGLAGALLAAIFVVRNVLSQRASQRPIGPALAWAVLWQGVVYGTVDALFLSVMPVFATWQAFSLSGLTQSVFGVIVAGATALAASILVTIAYHWGFPEYRGRQVRGPVIGNGVMSLAYLLTANPIAPLASHVAMHIAAVLHGAETAIQLPPHYSTAQTG